MKYFIAKYDSATRRCVSLAVYAVFFIVHLFCIPGPANATMLSSSVFDLQKISSNKESGKDNSHAADVKKIKLNISKRFQHAAGAVELHNAEPLPAIYFDNAFSGKPQHHLLISHILVSSLRGPPSFA